MTKHSTLLKDWFSAAQQNNLDKIQQLESSIQLDEEERQGWNALRVAAYNSSLEVTDYLLKKGSNSVLLDLNGETVLHDVARIGTALSLVLPYCKTVDQVSLYGTTPIMRASSVEAVQALLEKGADINRRNQVGGSWLAWNILDTHNALLKLGTMLSLTWDEPCSSALGRLKKELAEGPRYPERRERVEEAIAYAEHIYTHAIRQTLSESVPAASHSKGIPKI